EESDVDAPGVHADGVDLQFALPPGDGQTAADFVEQAQSVPIQAGGELHRSIGEAVQFFQRKVALFEIAQHDASAGGAEVDGEGFHNVGQDAILRADW